jgi:hypothetical protein
VTPSRTAIHFFQAIQIRVKNTKPKHITVTDGGEVVCVDPGEKEAILGARGPARQGREKAGSRLQTVEEDRRSGMVKDAGDGLATSSRDIYAQSVIVHCSSYTV